tara:strand:+ start:3147 stop:4529 length:1383 start_codon:yes stop_codon:yes gene_type:complete
MKYLYLIIVTILTFSLSAVAQEGSKAWEENFSAASHGQLADAGSVAINITNQGRDISTCTDKAKQQALYVVIFRGYGKSASGPASAPITEKSIYNQNADFFNSYLSSNSQGLSFVVSSKTNLKIPGSKISKKVIETTTTVTISKALLQKDLEDQNIIKGVADLGFKPEVLVVPGDAWMKKMGFMVTEDNQGMPVESYDYTAAVNDEFFNSLGLFVKAKFDDAFEMADFKSKLDAINAENQRNNSRADVWLQESTMDILARVVAAELWVKLDVVKASISGGMEMQFTITMSALDPLTQRTVINGLPQTIKTPGDNYMALLENTINAVSDEFRPRVLKYFTERQENGMKGKMEFRISDDLEINFESDIEYEEEEDVVSAQIEYMMGSRAMKDGVKASGAQTTTRLLYDVTIPAQAEKRGVVSSNNMKKFGNLIRKDIKKMGYNCTVESLGLGKVVVMLTEEI